MAAAAAPASDNAGAAAGAAATAPTSAAAVAAGVTAKIDSPTVDDGALADCHREVASAVERLRVFLLAHKLHEGVAPGAWPRHRPAFFPILAAVISYLVFNALAAPFAIVT